MLERIRPWFVFALGALLAFEAAWWYGILFSRLHHDRQAVDVIAVEALLRLVIPALGGGLALWMDRRPGPPRIPSPLRRRLRVGLAWALALGYLVTWSFGVPSVISRLTDEDARVYKELEARHHERFAGEDPPTFDTRIAVPLVPGVVIVYRETRFNVQAGWGGWVIYAWWGSGSRELERVVRWLI